MSNASRPYLLPDIEYRFIKIEGDDGAPEGAQQLAFNREERTFEGFASTFESPKNHDSYGTVFAQGAFLKTLKKKGPDGSNEIRVFWRHSEPLGMPVMMEERKRGLWVKGRISETSLGNDALTLIEDKVVQAMSIGFRTLKTEWLEDSLTKWKTPVRRILEAELFEFSPVIFPANPKALIKRDRERDAAEYRSWQGATFAPPEPPTPEPLDLSMLLAALDSRIAAPNET